LLASTVVRFPQLRAQESPEAPAIAKVEVLLVLLRIQSTGEKIRPEFFPETLAF